MAKTKDRIQDVRPYVERAVKDEDVRDNVLADSIGEVLDTALDGDRSRRPRLQAARTRQAAARVG